MLIVNVKDSIKEYQPSAESALAGFIMNRERMLSNFEMETFVTAYTTAFANALKLKRNSPEMNLLDVEVEKFMTGELMRKLGVAGYSQLKI